MFETNNTVSDSIYYLSGGLEADNFEIDFSYDVSVVSGNGNAQYGFGEYDTLDLSGLSVQDLTHSSFAESPNGGVIFDRGDGARVFDHFILSNGVDIYFEGIEQIIFSDQSFDLTFRPNDPGFDRQWNLHSMGVHTAWNLTTGTEDILLGVQDTGLGITAEGITHPDLNLERTLGVTFDDNVEDDYSFVNQFGTRVSRDDSHGSLVQGVIAAEANNGEGIAGINFNSTVANIDVLGESGADLVLADATQIMIDQARSQGQNLIINMSLGGGALDPDLERYMTM